MTRSLTFTLMDKRVDVNTISHITREIKKVLDENPTEGKIVCLSCNENLVSLCPNCYISQIKPVFYSHFSRDFSDKLVSSKKHN